MHKFILISLITLLCSCGSTITYRGSHFFYYDEGINSTTIKGFKEQDSLTLLGKWVKNENKAPWSDFYFKNNENLVAINFKKKINHPEFKSAPDIDFLANEVAHFNYLCDYFNLKCSLIETDDNSYQILNYLHEKTKEEIVHLVGMKNSTIIFISIINPKKNTKEKIKYIKELFNFIKT